jgi:hypothetical protein
MPDRPTSSKRAVRRRRVTSVLDGVLSEITVAEPFDLEQFCAALAERRQRGIRLVPMSPLMNGEPSPPFSGLWLGGASTDYLFYDDSTSPLHWQHSVLHEIAHMLLDHRAAGSPDDTHLRLLTLLMPDLDPNMLRRTLRPGLCRSRLADGVDAFLDEQEAEAELLGTRMWERWCDNGTGQHFAPKPSASEAEVISRLAAILGNGATPANRATSGNEAT